MAEQYHGEILPYQQLATVLFGNTPPVPDPGSHLSAWEPTGNLPDWFEEIDTRTIIDPVPQLMFGDTPPAPNPAQLSVWEPTGNLPDPFEDAEARTIEDFTQPQTAVVAPEADKDLRWLPFDTPPTHPEPPATIEDFQFPIFPTLPTPPAFEGVWQQKIEPTPDDEPVPASVGLTDAALFVPAPPLERWEPNQTEPILDDLGAFSEVAIYPLPVFTSQFLPPETPLPIPEDLHLPGDFALQVVELFSQAADLVAAIDPGPAEEEPPQAEPPTLLPLSSIVPLDHWQVPSAEPVPEEPAPPLEGTLPPHDVTPDGWQVDRPLPPAEDELEAPGEPVALFIGLEVVTLDRWFAPCEQPQYDEAPSLAGEMAGLVEPSLVAPAAASDWLVHPEAPPGDDEAVFDFTVVLCVMMISPPSAVGYYIDAVGWYLPGAAAAGASKPGASAVGFDG